MPEKENNKDLFRALLLDRESNPVILAYACFSQYGIDFFDTSLPALINYFQDQLNIEDLPQETIDKLGALKVLVSNDLFWEDWPTFEKISKALNNLPVLFNTIQPLTSEEVSYAVLAVNSLREHPYSDEVRAYLTVSCLDDGCLYPNPEVVKLFLTSKLEDNLKSIIDKLEKLYKKIKGKNLPKVDDPILYAQLLKTMRVKLYLEAKERDFREQLDKYKDLIDTKKLRLD